MKIGHKLAIRLYGTLWFGVGLMLMFKAIPLIVNAATQKNLPLIKVFQPLVGNGQQAALIIVVVGLIIGMLKGKTVLAKAAKRSIDRVKEFPNPMPIARLFSLRYLLVLFIMMALGMGLRLFPIAEDIHGLIDLAVGSALIQGAIIYFRMGSLMVRGTPSNL